jgi:uncharacterized membrane protein
MERRRAPRWMKLLLIASLAVNLAVAGYAAARVISGPRFVSAGPAASLMDARKLLWTMPRETRHALRNEFFERHHDEFMQYRSRWNEARMALASVLARPDAGDEEVRQAYQQLGKVEAEAAIRLRDVLAELTLRAPADARALFADRMGHDHRGFGHWRGGGLDRD